MFKRLLITLLLTVLKILLDDQVRTDCTECSHDEFLVVLLLIGIILIKSADYLCNNLVEPQLQLVIIIVIVALIFRVLNL